MNRKKSCMELVEREKNCLFFKVLLLALPYIPNSFLYMYKANRIKKKMDDTIKNGHFSIVDSEKHFQTLYIFWVKSLLSYIHLIWSEWLKYIHDHVNCIDDKQYLFLLLWTKNENSFLSSKSIMIIELFDHFFYLDHYQSRINYFTYK